MTTPDGPVAPPILAPASWTPAHVAAIRAGCYDEAPPIAPGDVRRISEDLDIWDAWPVQDEDGAPFDPGDGTALWMALGAPHFEDPDVRHGHARIHLLGLSADGWRHLQPVMPDGFSPGSREWSGSAVLAADRRTLTLFFTATGRREEATPSFEQRLFAAEATLSREHASWRLSGWRDLREIVRRDPAHYMASDAGSGAVGTIKAFRDPAYFHDPVTGGHHLLFAGSASGSASAFNGVIGRAHSRDGRDWTIAAPLVSADGLNNELERPHLVRHAGLYYLFWSTQRSVFDPAGPVGPTGLYGMVSDRLEGGWQPLNGTGLVFANPASAPAQAYSWLVLPDLQVTSFIDDWAPHDGGRTFGGTFAPMLRLRLDGQSAGLAA
jgi:levansucrase